MSSPAAGHRPDCTHPCCTPHCRAAKQLLGRPARGRRDEACAGTGRRAGAGARPGARRRGPRAPPPPAAAPAAPIEGDVPAVIVGSNGRIGGMLLKEGDAAWTSTSGWPADAPKDGPIYVCTRNDALKASLPPRRRIGERTSAFYKMACSAPSSALKRFT